MEFLHALPIGVVGFSLWERMWKEGFALKLEYQSERTESRKKEFVVKLGGVESW